MSRIRKIAAVEGAQLPVSLAQAKLQCRVDHAEEDALIGTYLLAATEDASNRLQRSLVKTHYRLTMDAFPPALELRMPPAVSVEAVSYISTSGSVQTLDPTDYLLDGVSEPGYVVPAPGRAWPETQDRINAVTVDYTAGYDNGQVPPAVVQWILLAVGDMYQHRERSAEKPAVPQGFADALLEPYRIWSL